MCFMSCTSQGQDRNDSRTSDSDFSAPIKMVSAKILLQNVNLIDVNGLKMQSHVNILLENGHIKNIYPYSKNEKIENIQVLNLENQYVIPGLIEAHSHVSRFPEEDLTKALYCGITSIRDMAGDGGYLAELKQAIYEGELLAPDIYFSAVMAGPKFINNDLRARISTPSNYKLGEAPWMRLVDEKSDYKKIVSEAKKCGATGLKLYADLSKETVKKLTDAAHKQGLKVWAHAYISPANALDVVESDVDVISHIPSLLYAEDWDLKRDGSMAISEDQFNTEYFKSIINTLKEKQIMVDATLSIFKSASNNNEEMMATIYKLTKVVYDAGIPITAGTDNSIILKRQKIPALYDEIQTFVNNCGMSPTDAIKCATKNGAIALGIEKTHGTIEIGKVANLVVLTNNPIEKIENIQSVNLVIKNGNLINKEDEK